MARDVVSDGPSPGTLYLVATPIGNLGDLTTRAREILSAVDFVLAEDTRHSRPLLEHLGISTPLFAHHAHNEAEATPGVVLRLVGGASAALVSDAGTPLLSDPGGRLVAAAIAAGVPVVPIPGASALLAALVGSGMEAVPFTFYGFLPRKGTERHEAISALAALTHTAVLYEAPPRVAETLADLAAAGLGERAGCVARELTKKFEEFRRGTVAELAAYYGETAPRGEVVLVIGGGSAPAAASEEVVAARAAALRADGMKAREIMTVLMDELRVSRNEAYRAAHHRD